MRMKSDFVVGLRAKSSRLRNDEFFVLTSPAMKDFCCSLYLKNLDTVRINAHLGGCLAYKIILKQCDLGQSRQSCTGHILLAAKGSYFVEYNHCFSPFTKPSYYEPEVPLVFLTVLTLLLVIQYISARNPISAAYLR